MKMLHVALSLLLVLPAAPVMAAAGPEQVMQVDAVPWPGDGAHECCDGADRDAGQGCCQDPACGQCIVMPAVPVAVQFMRPSSPATQYPFQNGGPVLDRQIAPPYRPPTA